MGGDHYTLQRNDIIYPKLSYVINGVLFDVYRQIGAGHKESYFQKAVAVGFMSKEINFEEQFYVPLKMNGEIVGKYFLDFLVEDKIVVELKRGRFVLSDLINQVGAYLESADKLLAIVACFTYRGVIIKRIINHKKLQKMKEDNTLYSFDVFTS